MASKPRKPIPIERRPRTLEDCLRDDSNSSSSNGFRSLSRKSCDSTVRNLLEADLNATDSYNTTKRLLRSPSKLLRSSSKAASTTVSAFRRASDIILNAVKYLPFTSVKSPSSLPRSISRRLLWKRRKNEDVRESTVTVKVKDILRWRSFRGWVEEKPPPLDLTSSTTTTGSTSTPGSYGSSWCDSDFTSEYLPSQCSNSEEQSGKNVEDGKKCLPEKVNGIGGACVGKDSVSAVDPKEEITCQEKERRSPVSVLDFLFGEDEQSFSPFYQSLANMERRKQKLMQKIQRFGSLSELELINLLHKRSSMEENTVEEEEEANGAEEKARQLLNHVKATTSVDSCKANVDHLLLDFFRHELATRRNKEDDHEVDYEMVKVAKAWMSEQHEGSVEWEDEGKREVYVRDMENGGRWNKFEEEQEELALEIEMGLSSLLIDELLVDLLVY